jgi:hypothetical protein
MTPRYSSMSYEELSPAEKERYNAIIKANSNRKKDLVYITKKGDKTTMTKGKFLVYFKPFEDGPQLPELFREKLGLASIVNKDPVQSTELSSKEEEEPKKTETDMLKEVEYDLGGIISASGSKLTDFQLRQLERIEALVSKKLQDKNLPGDLVARYEKIGSEIESQINFQTDLNKINSIMQQFKTYEDNPAAATNDSTEENLIRLYDSAKAITDKIYPGENKFIAEKWKEIKKKTEKVLKEDFGINPDDPQSRPNELSRIKEDYKKQEIQGLQEKYKKSEEDEKKGIPTNEVTEEDVLIISSDAPLYTEPELIVKEENLTDVFLKEEPLTEVKLETDYPYIALRRPVANLPLPDVAISSFVGPDVSILAAQRESPNEPLPQTDIATSDITESMGVEPGSEQIDETVVSETEPALTEQGSQKLPGVQAKYVFDVKYHKSQIAEYFFTWNQPAWDQTLSDSIKNSESIYSKEYLIETMNRLIQDPRFKINKVITGLDDKMEDILIEYHEISQIQFCIQRNMQTGKREKLIGMKLKDLVNIASLASGNPPVVNEEVQIDDSVSQVGVNQQMQPTPTTPNLVDPEQPAVIFPKDKEITINEIGERATKELDNDGKIKKLNEQLIKDMQRNSGADVIIGPFNEQKMRKSTINLEALRRVIE